MENPKVVWTEGMFLSPQHFQKSELYLENFSRNLADIFNSEGLYGFSSFEIDDSLLDIGKFGLRSARGIFKDGTPFDISQELTIDIPEGITHEFICLALPLYQEGVLMVSGEENSGTRYKSFDADVFDATESESEQVKLQMANLNLSLRLGSSSNDGYVLLPVAEVTSHSSGGKVVLNQAFIPECVNIGVSKYIRENIGYIRDKLEFRANLVSRRIQSSNDNKSYKSMIRDYMWMSALSEWTVLWRELAQNQELRLNPRSFYFNCTAMLGRMYGLDGRLPPVLKHWNFTKMYENFSEVFGYIFESLREVQSDNVTRLEWDTSLFASRHLLRALVRDKALFRDSRFVLVVVSLVGTDTLIREFPKCCKLAGNSEIASIVVNALSGIPLRSLPFAPSELRSRNDAAYFEIDTRSPLWQNIINNDEPIALHIDDRFGDIKVELSIIKQA